MILTDKEVWELTGLKGFRHVNHQLRKTMLMDLAARHFRPGARIADIGCAAGDLTMELQAQGFEMTGVEFEPARLERARALAERRQLKVRFVSKDLTHWSEARPFDGMIMGEVLEHFSEPRGILESHLPRLVPGGKILVTVPNMASLRARLKLTVFGEFADHNPDHRFYFTRRRFTEHFSNLPIDITELFSFLIEITFSSNRTLAKIERSLLKPLKWIMPWSGTHLVAVLQKR